MFWLRCCYGLLRTLRCHRSRNCDVTMLWPILLHGIRADLSGTPINALAVLISSITGCQSIDNWLDFKAMCCIFLLNNSIYIIKCNLWEGKVLVVTNKCSGLRPSVTLSSLWHGWRAMRAGVNNSLLNRLIYYFKAPREVSSKGRPAVCPAAADFPRDVCLTVSHNHKVILLYLWQNIFGDEYVYVFGVKQWKYRFLQIKFLKQSQHH